MKTDETKAPEATLDMNQVLNDDFIGTSMLMVTDVPGKIRNLKLPKHAGLLPIVETIVNSIQAIEEIRKVDKSYKGNIDVEFKRTKDLFEDNSNLPIEYFRITDNGIGFTKKNRFSFQKSESTYKLNIGGKGVGRFTWLKVFEYAKIESNFKDEEIWYNYKLKFVPNDNPFENQNYSLSNLNNRTTSIELVNPFNDFKSSLCISTQDLIFKIGCSILPYILLEDCPEIRLIDITYEKQTFHELTSFFKTSYFKEIRKGNFSIDKYNFSIEAIVINNKVPYLFNTINFCADRRIAESYQLKDKAIDFERPILYDGEKPCSILALIKGSLLDEFANQERTGFNIPRKKNDEQSTLFVSMDEIEHASFDKIKQLFEKELDVVRDEKAKKLSALIRGNLPQFSIILNYFPEYIDGLNLNLSEPEIEHQLMHIKTQLSINAKKKAKKVLERKRIHNEEQYNQMFDETINELSEISKSSLIDYVVHRKVIIELFDKILEMKSNGKFEYEKHIHNLIFQTKSTSDDLDYSNQNLWLIDEKLSYHKYLASDLPIDKKGERPDILISLFDNPLAYSMDDLNQLVNSMVIIEFKRPGREDYTTEDNPFTQVIKYVQKLRENKAKTPKKRPINVAPNCRFYCYIITDISTKSKELAKNYYNYLDTPDGMGLYLYNSTLNMYSEVISFSKLIGDAKQRNRVLFDKLDIN